MGLSFECENDAAALNDLESSPALCTTVIELHPHGAYMLHPGASGNRKHAFLLPLCFSLRGKENMGEAGRNEPIFSFH